MAHQSERNKNWPLAKLASASVVGMLTMSLIQGCKTGSSMSLTTSQPNLTQVVGPNAPVATVNDAQPVARAHSAGLIELEPGESLQQIIEQTTGNVVIDFYADWCGPCKRQARILNELESTAVSHEALIVKIDVDQHPGLANDFQVRSLPTLVLIKDGVVTQRRLGLTKRSELTDLLSR